MCVYCFVISKLRAERIACGFGRMNESGLRFCDDGIELDRKKRSSRDNRGSVFRSRKMGGDLAPNGG
jgi:hypothetical protein